MNRLKLIPIIILTLIMITSCKSQTPQEWADSRVWAPEGFTAKLHPSVNVTEFQKQYNLNKEVWDASFREIIKTQDSLEKYLDKGRVQIIEGRCNITVSTYTPREMGRIEGHRKFTDIQISSGNVLWGVTSPDKAEVSVPYKEDNEFFTSDSVQIYEQQASDDYVFIFFPEDLHIPSFAKEGLEYTEPLVKRVVKVEHIH